MFPNFNTRAVPTLTMDQMIEVDRIMIEVLGIDLVRMMENAGRSLARLVMACAGPRLDHVIVLAGTGGNGGGALVAARRLAGWDVDVSVHTSRPFTDYAGVIEEQLVIVREIGVDVDDRDSPAQRGTHAIIIDGLVGYSLSGAPYGRTAELITWANDQRSPSISLDAPSGFSAATESFLKPAITAHATMTLALPKTGLTAAPHYLGDLYCADIGVPASLYRDAFGIDIGDLYRDSEIVRLVDADDPIPQSDS